MSNWKLQFKKQTQKWENNDLLCFNYILVIYSHQASTPASFIKKPIYLLLKYFIWAQIITAAVSLGNGDDFALKLYISTSIHWYFFAESSPVVIYRSREVGGPMANFAQHYELIALGTKGGGDWDGQRGRRNSLKSWRRRRSRRNYCCCMYIWIWGERTLGLRLESGTEAHKSAYRLWAEWPLLLPLDGNGWGREKHHHRCAATAF